MSVTAQDVLDFWFQGDATVSFADFARSEARFSMLARANPDRADELVSLAQADVAGRWSYYHQLSELHRAAPGHAGETTIADTEDET